MDFPSPRVLIALRMDEKTLDEIKAVAARKGLNFSTLARMWITERLREERG
jgi:antitoxin component of RelBE/YafQ-DinJ toxin-antitoxin module